MQSMDKINQQNTLQAAQLAQNQSSAMFSRTVATAKDLKQDNRQIILNAR